MRSPDSDKLLREMYHEKGGYQPPPKEKPQKPVLRKWPKWAQGIAAVIAIFIFFETRCHWPGSKPPEAAENQNVAHNTNKPVIENPPLSSSNANTSVITPITPPANKNKATHSKIIPPHQEDPKPSPTHSADDSRGRRAESPESIWQRAMQLYRADKFVDAIGVCDSGIRQYPNYKPLREVKESCEKWIQVKKH
jgi:hypothetical protein